MILDEGYRALRQHTHAQNLEYLEGVAKVRFALSVVAELLNLSDPTRSQEERVLVVELFQQAKVVCTDPNINTIVTSAAGQNDTVGPGIYLIKLLVRQYGLSCLQKASKEHSWIVPEQLRKTGEVS